MSVGGLNRKQGFAAGLVVAALAAMSGGAAVAAPARSSHHVHVGRVRTAEAGVSFQFAQCMRAHGANQPDPTAVPGRPGLMLDIVDNGPDVSAARQACQPILDELIAAKAQAIGPAVLAARQREAQQFAACMSSQGFQLGQPQPPLYDVRPLLDQADREVSKSRARALQAARQACIGVDPAATG